MGANVFLKLIRAFEVNSLRLIVNFAVLEDLENVFAEMFTISVFAVAQLLFDCLEIDWLLYNEMIVGNIIEGNWFTERP